MLNFSAIKDLKIDLDTVEQYLVNAVIGQADKKGVEPTSLSLIICTMKGTGVFNKGKQIVRCKIYSHNEAFADDVVKLIKITAMDTTGAISGAFKEILRGEVEVHNHNVGHGISSETTKNYPNYIDLDKLECWISITEEDKLNMNFIYDHKLLRPYSIKDDYSEVDNVKIGDAVQEDELDQVQSTIGKNQNKE